jgi:hypothetical protein
MIQIKMGEGEGALHPLVVGEWCVTGVQPVWDRCGTGVGLVCDWCMTGVQNIKNKIGY